MISDRAILTEADTCRMYVLPKLREGGWTDDQIREQKYFTDARIIVTGRKYLRKPGKKADYLLYYRPDYRIAVVEAKANYKNPADGLQQAIEYAEILGLRFAYSTNGAGIVEHDYTTGEQQAVRAGDLLVAEIDAKVGGFGIVPAELDGAIVSSHYFLYQIDEAKCLRGWLDAFIRSGGLEDQVRARGTTNYAAIRPEHVFDFEIPRPPVDEQRRIVARIEELAVKIEEARGLRHRAAEEANALLASASDAAFQHQSGWTEARVGDFCEPPQYGYTASATTDPIGPRLLRITDIQNGRVNWHTVPFCHCPHPEPYLLQDNDIVFARTGATTGKSFLIRDFPSAVFASYLIRLRVQKWVTPEYLYLYFQTPSYWSQISEEKKGTGQPNVNGKKLANIRVPIAPPDEQRRIVTHLDRLEAKLDALKRTQGETAAELDALLPAILDKAFKGEL